MDCAVRVWKIASQRRPVGMSEETLRDGRLKSAGTTYRRLTLPGYRHSVPVHEALKETRWPDFHDGHWGNRENPPAPEGDVHPKQGLFRHRDRRLRVPPGLSSTRDP